MLPLLGTLLRLLIHINLSAYKENFQPFATVGFFFQDIESYYDNLLESLNLLTIHNSRRNFNAFFLNKYHSWHSGPSGSYSEY
jgi:hypothetical protein